MDIENVCFYELVIRWMCEEMDNAWLLERVGEWVNEWNYESEFENEEVCELMSEDLYQYVSE